MKALRTVLNPFRVSTSRFDRYYGGVLRQGSGYPTADEARKDLRRLDELNTSYNNWVR